VSTDREHDLHGIAREPFPDFSESCTYLERVTVPEHDDAVDLLRRVGFEWPGEPELERIWMRHGAPDPERNAGWEEEAEDHPDAWWECDEDHPEAVPFWKDGEE
jgi:hypothetical protein